MEKQTKTHTIANYYSTTIPCLISFILLLLSSNGSVYCNAFTSTNPSLFSIRSYTQNKMGPGPGGPMRDGPGPMGQRSFGGPDGMGPPPMGEGAFIYVVIVVSFSVGQLVRY